MSKIISVFLVLLLFSLFGCGEINQEPNRPTNPIITPTKPSETIPTTPTEETIPVSDIEFSVSLIYNHNIYIPTEEINIVWCNDYSQVKAPIDEDGFARTKGLDGEYNVYLDVVPTGYTYNPNIYVVNNDSPTIEIELERVLTIRNGRGTGLYNEYKISTTGHYRANITSASKKVFYEYQPKEAGYYVIESHVNIFEDTVNPIVDLYDGTVAWKESTPDTLNDGGAYKKGGYTKNFKWVVRLYEAQLSNVFTFAIYAESKIGVYPVTVDFTISYEGEYYYDDPVAKLMVPQASLIPTPEASDYLNLELALDSSAFRFKFATYSNIYFETITYNKLTKEDVYAWDACSLSIASEDQTAIEKVFTGITSFDPKKDGEDDSYDESVETRFSVTFNADGTGSYEVKTIYTEFERDGLAETVVKTEDWNYETGTFTYQLDAVKKTYCYYNSNGGTGSYYNSTVNGPTTIDGDNFKFDEESGYWRVYDSQTDTFGPFVCVSIAVPCAYYDPEGALNFIESHGNKALTVKNLETDEFENHKQFIEVYYTSICNSDGVCFVTMEMKDFLQKFSVSQRLFFDGNGYVEYTGVYATENDQWLFACGYYDLK